MSTQVSNRRRWERVPLAIPVFARGVDSSGEQFLDFTTLLDISAGGAVLAIRRDLPQTSSLTLEIPAAPLSDPNAKRTSKRTLQGKVVRISSSQRCYLYALEFSNPLQSLPQKEV